MPLTPMARRAADEAAQAAIDAVKARCRLDLERIQNIPSPPLTNGELSRAFELPLFAIGQFKSDAPRSRRRVPDAFVQGLIGRLLAGSAVLAIGQEGADGRRAVLVCEASEVARLGAEWTALSLDGRPITHGPVDWEDDSAWDLFGDTPSAQPTPQILSSATGGTPAADHTGPTQVPPLRPVPIAGFEVPPIGLGGMRLSTDGRPDRKDALAALLAALKGGVQFFDTANVYALDETDIGHNESLMAEALAEWGERDAVLVASKGGLMRRGRRWLPATAPDALKAACEASLKALKVDCIDLYQLHAVDRRVPIEESVGALLDLQRAGKIAHIGLCNVSAKQIDAARAVAPIASVQHKCNPFDKAPFVNGLLEHCDALGLPFIAHSPVGGHKGVGRLLRSKPFVSVAEKHGVTPHAVCLAWLARSVPNGLVIPGPSRLESARSCAEASRLTLGEDDLSTLDGIFPFGRTFRRYDTPVAAPGGELVVVMGSPASGKTTLAMPYVDRGHHRLNRDTLGGTLDGLVKHFEAAADSGVRHFVADNTYPTRKSRQRLIAAAKARGLAVHCQWLDISKEDAFFNASRRQIQKVGRLLAPHEFKEAGKKDPNLFPPIVLHRWAASLEAPTLEEGFATVERKAFVRDLGPDYTGKALLLDYDGTLRETRSGHIYPKHPDDVKLLPKRRKWLEAWQAAGYRLLGISNQSGVSTRQLTKAAAQACLDRTAELLELEIDGVFCPHPAGQPQCFCRKPLPGFGAHFVEKYKLDPSRCVYVGDRAADEGFAKACGFHFVWAKAFFGRAPWTPSAFEARRDDTDQT